MKQYLNYLLSIPILLCSVLISCDDKVEYIDSKEPQSITILNITDNIIPVHTTETYQVELAVLPEDAEFKNPPLYEYISGNEEVFTISDKGLIKGIGVGEAVLYINSTNYPALKTKSIVSITDRTFDVEEIVIDEKFKDLTITIGTTINLSTKISIKPENATNKKLGYTSSNTEVVSITETGVIQALKNGTSTIKVSATDGSSKFIECKITVKEATYTDLDRTGWIVTPSHKLPKDASINNAPESLIDGDLKTCMSMVKPGKSYDGITVAANEQVFFVIDMQKEVEFDYLSIQHRTSNTNEYLRSYGFSIYGSNNGTEFSSIEENLAGEPSKPEYKLNLPTNVKYRYIKVVYSLWDTKTGSTIQLAELNIGAKHF